MQLELMTHYHNPWGEDVEFYFLEGETRKVFHFNLHKGSYKTLRVADVGLTDGWYKEHAYIEIGPEQRAMLKKFKALAKKSSVKSSYRNYTGASCWETKFFVIQ